MLNRPIPKNAKLGVIGVFAVVIAGAILLPMAAAAKDDKEQQTRFIATLPNGVEVELVGICEHPSAGKQWWQPDGMEMKEPEYELRGKQSYKYPAFGYLLKFSPFEDLSYRSKINLEHLFMKSGPITNKGQAVVFWGENNQLTEPLPYQADVQVDVAAGDWKVNKPGRSGVYPEFTNLPDRKVIILSGLRPNPKEGMVVKTLIEATTTSIDVDIQLECITAGGKSHTSWHERTLTQEGQLIQHTFGFAIPIQNIEKINVKHRKFYRVVFKNVSLQPGAKTDVQVEDNESLPSQFVATLPNGVTAELVGISRNPTEAEQWWQPDGSNMSEPSYKANKRIPPFASIPTQYIFLAKATGGKDLSLKMRIYEGFGLSTRIASDGTALCHVRHPNPEQAYHKDGFEKGPIEIGVAQGPWLRARGVNENIEKLRSYLIGSHDEIIIQPPQPEESSPEMATIFWATVSSHDYEYRLMCTLKGGEVKEVMRPNFQHTSIIETGGKIRSPLATVSFSIDLPVDQIADYELLYRKFDYVRFNNVAFKPGMKTDVQVEAKNRKETLAIKKNKVYLPDLETPDANVVLDFATGQMLSADKMENDQHYFDKSGKGDLAYEYASGQNGLLCLRGARMQMRTADGLSSLKPDVQRSNFIVYVIRKVPCQYQITTAEGNKYELKVLSVDKGDKGGAHIEHWKSGK